MDLNSKGAKSEGVRVGLLVDFKPAEAPRTSTPNL